MQGQGSGNGFQDFSCMSSLARAVIRVRIRESVPRVRDAETAIRAVIRIAAPKHKLCPPPPTVREPFTLHVPKTRPLRDCSFGRIWKFLSECQSSFLLFSDGVDYLCGRNELFAGHERERAVISKARAEIRVRIRESEPRVRETETAIRAVNR